VVRFPEKTSEECKIKVVSNVIGKVGSSIEFDADKIDAILWYPPVFYGAVNLKGAAINLKGAAMPYFICMNPEDFIVVLSKLEAQDICFKAVKRGFSMLLEVSKGEEKKKIFFIKTLICKSEDLKKAYKLKRGYEQKKDCKLKNVFLFFDGNKDASEKEVIIAQDDALPENKYLIYFTDKFCEVAGSFKDKLLPYLIEYSKYEPELVRKINIGPRGEKTELVASWQRKPAALAAYVAYCLLNESDGEKVSDLIGKENIVEINKILRYDFLKEDSFDDFAELLLGEVRANALNESVRLRVSRMSLVSALDLLKRKLFELANVLVR
jgi:hypothetical protein